MSGVEVQLDLPAGEPFLEVVREAAEATLAATAAPRTALTLLLTGDDALRRLNRDFLGLDEPTDVLSFPAGAAMPGMEPYLGDVAISVPQATRQAQAAGHLLAAELQLLAVHGVLHLLGYDHLEAEDKRQMWALQAQILATLGAEITQPAE